MKPLKKNSGFTLIELMVAMVLSAIVTVAIYSTYRAQLSSHITQQTVVEMQQNARAAMFAMERRIKHAGFNPKGPAALHNDYIGILTDFTALNPILDPDQDDPDTKTDATHIAFTLDTDKEGDIDNNDDELVAYRLDNENLEVWMQDTDDNWGWQTLAENIEALDFVYLGADGNPLPAPLNPSLIRSVQITLIAKSGSGTKPPVLMMKYTDYKTYENQQGDDPMHGRPNPPNDNFRRIALSANVQCRNLSL